MSSNDLLRASTKELPIHKGRRRVWIETKKLLETDLSESLTYHYKINEETKELTLATGELDNRKITVKKKEIDACDRYLQQ